VPQYQWPSVYAIALILSSTTLRWSQRKLNHFEAVATLIYFHSFVCSSVGKLETVSFARPPHARVSRLFDSFNNRFTKYPINAKTVNSVNVAKPPSHVN
jgi:hypothetical protein